LFVPDLSECLPSLDAWRDQWLAHKRAVAERERQLSLEKEVCSYFVCNIGFISFTYAKVFCAKKKKKKSCSNKCRDRNSKLCAHMDGQADILRLSADQITACETIQSCTLSIMLEFVLFVINNVLKKKQLRLEYCMEV
jgi:hypothetical protein